MDLKMFSSKLILIRLAWSQL